MVDGELQVQAFIEEPSSKANTSQSPDFSNTELPWLPDIVKDFVFPAGFPGLYFVFSSFGFLMPCVLTNVYFSQ